PSGRFARLPSGGGGRVIGPTVYPTVDDRLTGWRTPGARPNQRRQLDALLDPPVALGQLQEFVQEPVGLRRPRRHPRLDRLQAAGPSHRCFSCSCTCCSICARRSSSSAASRSLTPNSSRLRAAPKRTLSLAAPSSWRRTPAASLMPSAIRPSARATISP